MKSRSFVALACASLFSVLCAARADEKADALFKEIQAAYTAAQSLTAEIVMVSRSGGNEFKSEGTVKLKRPNLARIEMTGRAARTVVSDGKTLWNYTPASNQYQKLNADEQGRNIIYATPASHFFNSSRIAPPEQYAKTVLGTETVDGKDYTVLQVQATFEGNLKQTIKYYVGSDKLIHRIASEIKRGEEVSTTSETVLKKLKVGVEIPTSEFAYEPPKEAKLYEPPKRPELLAVGTTAPEFDLPTPQGGKLSLADARKGKKAVLINFWFVN